MKNLRKKILLICFLPLALLSSFSVVYKILTDKALSLGEELIKCSFKHRFRLYCPGCGGSRSLSALLDFDFLRSFILFPALPITVLILLYFFVTYLLAFIKNDEKILRAFKPEILIVIPSVIILNFFIRNALLFFGIDLIGDFY